MQLLVAAAPERNIIFFLFHLISLLKKGEGLLDKIMLPLITTGSWDVKYDILIYSISFEALGIL